MNKLIEREYNSDNYGKFVIIDDYGIDETGDRKLQIQFLKTGYITTAYMNAVRHGKVKDRYFPSISGVGFIGDFQGSVTVDPEIRSIYRTWADMLSRCYNEKKWDYYLYGGLGIKVHPDWFCFNTFLNDAISLPGYINKKSDPANYQLDKDYLQMNIPKKSRIYSKDTCIWISKTDNIIIMNREKSINDGYYGVVYRDHGWCVRIGNKIYGKFNNPEAAACYFNLIYPKLYPNNISILNDVKNPIPNEELYNYSWYSLPRKEYL